MNSSPKNQFLLYGATGYTGVLIAEEASRRGLKPILAGRNQAKVSDLATRLGLPSRVFDCTDPLKISENLNDVALVLHCAGPFVETSRPMLEACLLAGAHYLDITGELEVVEAILSQSQRIQQAGIVAIPGVGFDVVPTDCLAAQVKRELPDAVELLIAIRTFGSASPGTSKSIIEILKHGCKVRRNGKLQEAPLFSKSEKFSFSTRGTSPRTAYLAPLADVSSAYYSTAIPNIECFSVMSDRDAKIRKGIRFIIPILTSTLIRRVLKNWIGRMAQGPNEADRSAENFEVAAKARNEKGTSVEKVLSVPNGYSLTIDTALAAVQKVLQNRIPPGSYTPSQAFSPDFIYTFQSVKTVTL